MPLLRAAALLLCLLGLPAMAQGQSGSGPGDRQPIELMFVQTATGVTFDGTTLTLSGLPAATVFFSDRPERLVGHMANDRFVELWNYNVEGFKADPPNAALSMGGGGDAEPVIVELSSAKLDGNSIAYQVRVLSGTLPASAGEATLFIDPWMWVPPDGPGWDYRHCWWNRWGHRVCRWYD